MTDLAQEIAKVLNRASAENGSDTPDFVLAGFLLQCLHAFDGAMAARKQWYGDAAQAHPKAGRAQARSDRLPPPRRIRQTKRWNCAMDKTFA